MFGYCAIVNGGKTNRLGEIYTQMNLLECLLISIICIERDTVKNSYDGDNNKNYHHFNELHRGKSVSYDRIELC